MRFSKRNRNPLSWGRRAKRNDGEEPEFTPVGSGERSALLGGGSGSTGAESMADEEMERGQDPVRQLLTVLGRLQREVTRTTPEEDLEAWADQCMNLLIDGVEIALKQGWDELADGLTETGRILQSCENSGRTRECMDFLADSCSIFCLLASNPAQGGAWDLMLSKWRQRYEAALKELGQAGIPLVGDDGQTEEIPVERTSALEANAGDASESEGVPFEMPPLNEQDESELAGEDLPSLDELPSLEEAFALTSGYNEESAEEEAGGETPDMARPSMGESAPASGAGEENEADAEGEPSPESGPDFREVGPTEELADLDELEPLEPLRETEIPHESNGLSPEVVEILDTLCDGLSRIEQKGPADMQTTTLAMEEGLNLLRETATAEGRPGAVSACDTMQRMLEVLGDLRGSVDDRFFDLGYAFCGVYADAKDPKDDPVIQDWAHECDAFIEACANEGTPEAATAVVPEEEMEESMTSETASPGERPAAEQGEPQEREPVSEPAREDEEAASEPFPGIPQAGVDAGSAQTLLEDARHAVAEGRADAELLTLRAAASIARAKADRAKAQVQEMEAALQQAGSDIDRARRDVEEAEREVAGAEEAVRTAEGAVENRAKEREQVQGRLGGLVEDIGNLDEQIRKLQEQRQAKETERAEAQQGLEETEAALARDKEQTEQRKNAEERAREKLEDMRLRVKHSEQKRAEVEASMTRAREALTRQREALADMEQMVERLGASDAGDANDSLLFDL